MMVLLIWVVCLAVAVPVAILAAECTVGAFGRGLRQETGQPPPFIVLMPAHDEAAGIASTVVAVRQQLRPCDELLVVADNCTDDTAATARRLGATVVERSDVLRRGKGHALEFGREFIEANRSEAAASIIVVLDADCRPERNALQSLAGTASLRNAVVQGADLLDCPPDASAVVRVSCLAFLIKNLVRQRALQRLAGTVLLQGTGMAFPRPVFARARWATGSLVEDLEMGLELLLDGNRVLFNPSALFLSSASSAAGTASQRRRWEHGMLQIMCAHAPRLIAAGLSGRKNARLLVIGLDLLVPPTVLLGLLAFAATGAALALGGLSLPVLILVAADVALGFGILAAWWVHGRAILPVRSLGEVPGYVVWKMPILAQFITRRERQWIRTERRP
ncbi:glycosyltransferase family 2 protein [Altericroceibacterium xinjiangense]|uniref:glycosyltransferase family 2 protein n=1 Tax=Altericroceibacterium xinjiangense TaxID=762261 RepID=UPI000F7DCAFD|nr:glycosyltransferase family 2 protein [Altericroceibacterium xinjiangense]